MFNFKKMLALPVSIALAVSLTACGGQAFQNQTPNGTSQIAPSGNPSTTTGTGTSKPVTTSGGSTSDGASADNTADPTADLGSLILGTDFSVLGTRGVTTPSTTNHTQFRVTDIATDNVLNIALTASAPGTVSNGGYQIAFQCIKFTVKVGDSTQTAFVSTVGSDISSTGAPCNGAKANPVLKFRLPAGHGLMSATVTSTVYDNCNQQYDPFYGMGRYWSAGCALNLVANEHWISGHVDVYVNGTN